MVVFFLLREEKSYDNILVYSAYYDTFTTGA